MWERFLTWEWPGQSGKTCLSTSGREAEIVERNSGSALSSVERALSFVFIGSIAIMFKKGAVAGRCGWYSNLYWLSAVGRLLHACVRVALSNPNANGTPNVSRMNRRFHYQERFIWVPRKWEAAVDLASPCLPHCLVIRADLVGHADVCPRPIDLARGNACSHEDWTHRFVRRCTSR